MAENRLLQRSQLRAGLDPDLLDQRPTPLAVACERVGLPPVAVERQHQLTPQLLVERLRRDRPLQVGDQLVVASERERHLDALRLDGTALILEPRACRTRIPFQDEIAEHITPPEGERLVEAPQGL